MTFELGPRRGIFIDIADELEEKQLSTNENKAFEDLDLIYRSLCTLMYNYVPTSGHPGGSISSGRFVASLIFDAMDYDMHDPDRYDADLISYAAGHKALGLYAMWALRNEIARVGAPQLLPKDEKKQLRLEDLLGFRRNPVTKSTLFTKFNAKPLDGHPTPATPFIKLSTGASGVGLTTSLGLAFGAADYYGEKAPRVHIVEGEGGLTPGRVAEGLAAAGTASLSNAILHIDWNQASIDSDRVCRDKSTPGDYVQWTPAELCYLNDWNVIAVPNGRDFHQILCAQDRAAKISNNQPTAIVYKTIKGWRYGIEGRASHGAGHKLCSAGFYSALKDLIQMTGADLPKCETEEKRCAEDNTAGIMEVCFWEALTVIRSAVENNTNMVDVLSKRLLEAQKRLNVKKRQSRKSAPQVDKIFPIAGDSIKHVPDEVKLVPGNATTLRGELGKALNYYNKISGGAIFAAAADLLGSTSVSTVANDFAKGFFNTKTNAEARLLSIGGICEDAISGILSGISTYGKHIGVGSSYGAFIAPLGHIAARLHAIGNQARQHLEKEPYKTFILICAHAGLKTGEDGPTHADPQALQLLQENFPKGCAITLTPWDPQEIWPLLSTALSKRPAIIAPFVTRPTEKIYDRQKLKLTSVNESVKGVYALRSASKNGDGTIVLQGSGVTYAFVEEALPLLEKEGLDLNIYYVSSAELFDMLPPSEQRKIFPEEHARTAMGITGFTLPTMFRWITSERGRAATLHPFKKGHYLGSGQAEMVLKEAGLDGESQYRAIVKYISTVKQG